VQSTAGGGGVSLGACRHKLLTGINSAGGQQCRPIKPGRCGSQHSCLHGSTHAWARCCSVLTPESSWCTCQQYAAGWIAAT